MEMTPDIEKAIEIEIAKYVREHRDFLDRLEKFCDEIVSDNETFRIMWGFELLQGHMQFLSSHLVRIKERRFKNN